MPAVDSASSLIETKFYLPRPRSDLVVRPRLSERLNRAIESKLTLVSAPAGFGKTTLLAAWLAATPADGRSVALSGFAQWASVFANPPVRKPCGITVALSSPHPALG